MKLAFESVFFELDDENSQITFSSSITNTFDQISSCTCKLQIQSRSKLAWRTTFDSTCIDYIVIDCRKNLSKYEQLVQTVSLNLLKVSFTKQNTDKQNCGISLLNSYDTVTNFHREQDEHMKTTCRRCKRECLPYHIKK